MAGFFPGKSITELVPVETPLTGAEVLPTQQGGITRKVTVAQLSGYGASVGVQSGGVAAGTEPNINFIAGSNVVITAVDNPVSSRVDITIASSGGSSGSGDVTGPSSATDFGIATYSGTSGKIIRSNTATIDANGAISAANLTGTSSGINTGDQTITLTGDANGSGTGAITLTLTSVNSNIGAFNTVTVNAKGLVTGASNVSYQFGTVSSIATQSGISGGTITSTGTLGITNFGVDSAQLNTSGVTYAKIQNVTSSRLLGNPTSTAGAPSEISLGSGLSFSGTTIIATATGAGTVTQISTGTSLSGGPVTTSGTIGVTNFGIDTAQVNTSAITYAKIQNVSTSSRALGRNTASVGAPEEVTVSQILDWVGSAVSGDILVRGATWGRLAKGAANTFLAMDTSAGTLEYKTASANTSLTLTVTGASVAWGVTNNGIGNAQIRQGAALSLIGNNTNGTANVADIAAASDFQVMRRSGAAIAFGAVDVSQANTSVTGIQTATNGGTGNAFFLVSGPTTTVRTFTFPNASATVLTTNAAVTAPQGGTGFTSYAIGDTLYADTTTSLAKLVAAATGSVLLSGTLPSWGKANVASTVTGILPVANGGTGIATATANRLMKGNGTSAFQVTGINVGTNDELSLYKAQINSYTSSSVTLSGVADCGCVVEFTATSAITLTLPTIAATSFVCTIIQTASQITFTTTGSAVFRNRSSHNKTAGQWAATTLYVRSNSGGSAAEYVLAGDTST